MCDGYAVAQSLRRCRDESDISKRSQIAKEDLGSHADVTRLLPDEAHLLLLPFLGEDAPAHGQHGLESFLALSRVLTEPLDESVLDAVLDALPATSQGSDLGLLVKLGLVLAERGVDDGLLDVEQVTEGDVGRDHGDGLGLGVDVGGLKHLRLVHATAHHALEPFRSSLTAGDQTLGA